MKTEEVRFQVQVYDSLTEMEPSDAQLLLKAQEITQNSYAPYSRFNVGAAARLVNQELVTGTNQENASYPAGICAERTLMSVASTLYPGVGIHTIAISYNNLEGKSDHPISPCGICRQSFAEFQMRTGQSIRLILGGMEGPIYLIEDIAQLLPLSFGASDMS